MPNLGYQTNGEYIIRCPACGDSSNPQHGHLYVNFDKGTFNCFRCGYSGKLDVPFLMKNDISLSYFSESTHKEKSDKIQEFYPFQYSKRYSSIELSSVKYKDSYWDYSDMYNQWGHRVGYHLRHNTPKMAHTTITEHGRGIIWPYAPKPLKSSYSKPLVIVEGIYDAIDNNDVVVFGSINKSLMKFFRGHYVMLSPDGDVFTSEKKFKQFQKTLKAFSESYLLQLVGVRAILNGKDIDEADAHEISILRGNDIKDLL